MSKVFLKDAKISLVSFDLFQKVEERIPAVIIHADLSMLDVEKSRQGESGGWELRTSVIHEIIPASEETENPMLNIFFYLGENTVAVRVPVQFMALSLSFSSDEQLGKCPIFLINSNTTNAINPAKTYSLKDVDYFLAFPSASTDLHNEFSEVLGTVFNSSMSQQLALIPLDEVTNDFRTSEKDLMAEEILGISLNAVLSLIRDDISPIMSIPELIEYKRSDEDHETAPLPVYFSLLSTIMSYVDDLSPVNKPIYNVDMGNKQRLSSFGNAEFTRIISPINDEFKESSSIKASDEFLKDAEYVKWKNLVDQWDAPVQDNWPAEMSGVKSYLESIDLFDSIVDVANSASLSDSDKQIEFLAKYGPSTTLLGVYVRIALHIYKEIEKLTTMTKDMDPENVLDDISNSPSNVALAWFSLIDMESWWELTSVSEELTNFNITNASTIIKFGMVKTDEMLQAPYLLAVIKHMGIYMMDDDHLGEFERDDWVAAFNELEIGTQDFRGMKEFFLNYYDAMDEILEEAYQEEGADEDDTIEVDYEELVESALNAVITPHLDFDKVADYTALMIPVVAEIKANIAEDRFTESWDIIRKMNLDRILLEFSEEIGRRVSINGL